MSGLMQRMWTFLGFAGAEDPAPGETAPGRRANILNLHAPRAMEIIVLEPEAYGDAQAAADYLKAHRPIVVNLRGAQTEMQRRVVDFLSGVAYALDGHMHRVGEEIFLFTPHHVSITAEHLREEAAAGGPFAVE